jgi:hypothetical protein
MSAASSASSFSVTAVAARFRDVLLDIDDGLLEAGDTDRLVETLRGED